MDWHYQLRYQTPLRFTLVTGDIVLFAVSLSLVLGVVAGALAAAVSCRHPLVLLGRSCCRARARLAAADRTRTMSP